MGGDHGAQTPTIQIVIVARGLVTGSTSGRDRNLGIRKTGKHAMVDTVAQRGGICSLIVPLVVQNVVKNVGVYVRMMGGTR